VGDQPRPNKQGRQPQFLLAASKSYIVRDLRPKKKKNEKKKKKKKEKKKKGGKLIFQLETQREGSSVLKEAQENSEGGEKNSVFHIDIYVRDWRVIYGPILMKFQYVVPDDEGYSLTGVDRWISSPVARLFIRT